MQRIHNLLDTLGKGSRLVVYRGVRAKGGLVFTGTLSDRDDNIICQATDTYFEAVIGDIDEQCAGALREMEGSQP